MDRDKARLGSCEMVICYCCDVVALRSSADTQLFWYESLSDVVFITKEWSEENRCCAFLLNEYTRKVLTRLM